MLFDDSTEEGGGDEYPESLRLARVKNLAHILKRNVKHISVGTFMSIILDSKRNFGSTEYCWLYVKMLRGSGLDHAKAMLHSINFDVNDGVDGTMTPLMASVQLVQEELVTLLMQKGADVNARDSKKKTSLHYAVHEGNVKILRHILTPECYVNAQDELGETALHVACWRGNQTLSAILLEQGAKPDIRDKVGMTPLHHASSRCTTTSSRIIRLLLDKRPVVKIDAQNMCLATPLMLAVEGECTEKAELLLKEGADCNTVVDYRHHLPLHKAICYGSKKMLTLMMNHTCPDAKESLCVNPSGSQNIADVLCIACSCNPQMLPLLLESKQHITCGRNYQISESPRDSVSVYFPFEMDPCPTPFLNMFLDPKIQLAIYKLDTPLALLLANHAKCGVRFMELLKVLLGAGAEVNPKACSASAPLVYYLALPARGKLQDPEHLMMLELLMSYGLDPDYRIRSDQCNFGGPDTLAAACLNDPRSLAYFLRMSRTTPRQLLSHWTKLFELAANRPLAVRNRFRTAFSLRMSISLKVMMAYGQHDLAREDLVWRFAAFVQELTHVPLEVNEDDLHEMKKVPSLAHLSRASLREFMSHSLRPEVMVKEAVHSFGIPYHLQDFLLYSDVPFKQFPSSYENL